MKSIPGRQTLPHLVTIAAVAFLVGTGTTYAAQQVTGQQISNNSVTAKDIKDGTLTGLDIRNGSLTGIDVAKDSLTSGDLKDATVQGKDVANESLGHHDLGQGSVRQSEIATDAVGGAEVDDFSLTNQDVGVLFAKVRADGTLQGTSGSTGAVVTVTNLPLEGNYRVDFHTNINFCAFTASVGEPAISTFEAYGVAAVSHYNSTSVGVTTTDTRGTFEDRPFHLIVVC